MFTNVEYLESGHKVVLGRIIIIFINVVLVAFAVVVTDRVDSVS